MIDSKRLDGVVGRCSKESGVELVHKSVECNDTKLLGIQLFSHQLHTSHMQHCDLLVIRLLWEHFISRWHGGTMSRASDWPLTTHDSECWLDCLHPHASVTNTVISTLRWAVLTVLCIGFCHTGNISLCVDLFVFVCICVFFCFILHSCCIIMSTVGWTWWDWSLILRTYLPSVLWHCWLGHLTRKNPSPIWPTCVWWDVKPYSIIKRCLEVWKSKLPFRTGSYADGHQVTVSAGPKLLPNCIPITWLSDV